VRSHITLERLLAAAHLFEQKVRLSDRRIDQLRKPNHILKMDLLLVRHHCHRLDDVPFKSCLQQFIIIHVDWVVFILQL